MKSPLLRSAVKVLILCCLGGYFVYAGWSKWQQPDLFATQIDSYRLLPGWMAVYAAAGLPVYEMVAGCLLLFRKTRRIALVSILLMLSVFCVALLSALLRGLEINCGCTGADEVGASGLAFSLLRNILFISAGVWVYCVSEMGSGRYTDKTEWH